MLCFSCAIWLVACDTYDSSLLLTGDSGNSGAGALLELIDDFEDQDQWLLPVHKRNGPWYVFNDGTKAGKEEPLTIALLGADNARPGSVAALHLVASGFTDWGAGV